MSNRTIVFISQLDINLLKFRLPIMIALQKKGWRVVAMVPKGEYFKEFERNNIDTHWIPIKRRSINPINELNTIFKLYLAMRAIQPDIVHAFTIKPNIYASMIARIVGVKKVIASVTGMGAFYSETNLKSRLMQYVINSFYRIVGLFSDHIMFQNMDDLNEFIAHKLVKKSKVICIKGSGIDTFEWKKTTNSKNKAIQFILVARLLKTKGILDFCEAAKAMKKEYGDQVSFNVLGDVDSGNPDSLQRADIEPYIEEKEIVFLGWVDNIKEQLDRNDVFVLPSYYREGIPRTGIEAASMSMPIITTHSIGCKELVDHHKNGVLVRPKAPQELIEAMEMFVKNPDLIDTMGAESRKKAEKEFDISMIKKQYINLYEN